MSLVTTQTLANAWRDCGIGGAGGRLFLSAVVAPVLWTCGSGACLASRVLLPSARSTLLVGTSVCVLMAFLTLWQLAGPSDYPVDQRDSCATGNVPTWWPAWLPH